MPLPVRAAGADEDSGHVDVALIAVAGRELETIADIIERGGRTGDAPVAQDVIREYGVVNGDVPKNDISKDNNCQKITAHNNPRVIFSQ